MISILLLATGRGNINHVTYMGSVVSLIDKIVGVNFELSLR